MQMMQQRATVQPTMHRAFTSAAPCKRLSLVSRSQSRRASVLIRASADTAVVDTAPLWTELGESCAAFRKAPISMKLEYSSDILDAMNALKAAGAVPKWGSESPESGAAGTTRQNKFNGELKMVGIKSPDQLATPSVRNDAAFLFTVTGVFSVLAVILGQLPGDWGFFSSYLTGGVVLGVLAVGSTAPGLLQGIIDKFSQLWPDYKERVVGHEAAHLLIGYLMGVPVTSYSVGIGQEHVEFAEAKLQARIFTKDLTDEEIDALAAVAVAGMASEGLKYEQVMGQNADLSDLQRILLRSKTKLSNNQQQNITRWAVWRSALLLKQYKAEYEAVQAALNRGATVDEIVRTIEGVQKQ